jgi:hypothetical protein
MKAAIASVLFALLTIPTQARIGESAEELSTRYGKAEESVVGKLVFRKNGIFVTATLMEGKCQSLVLSPYKESPSRQISDGEPLTQEQIDRLLTANAPGSKWVGSRQTGWKTEDGLFSAFAIRSGIAIETAAFTQAKLEKLKAQEADKIDGF